MEPLLKGKAQYNSPPCPNKLRSAALDTTNIIYFFTKQATLMRRSTMLSLPLHLVFPSTIMKRPNLQNEVSKIIPKKFI